tara:strand:+ start:452 stop:622 length:171 start_codon:yes stop_codon:yes gene_type:complete
MGWACDATRLLLQADAEEGVVRVGLLDEAEELQQQQQERGHTTVRRGHTTQQGGGR